MLSIENQIAAVQGILKDGYYRESDATLIESILSSLERLRDAEAQEPPRAAIEKILDEVMGLAVSNGADSRSMPDEYVEVAARLCDIPPQSKPAIPEGFALVPIEPTDKQQSDAAFNLCAEFGPEFTAKNEAFALAVYRELVAAARGGE